MSGFTSARRYGRGQVFELTSTKAAYWHRYCDRDDCQGDDIHAIVDAHVIPAGFTVVRDGGNYIALDGPGIAEGATDALYDAVSGRPRRNRDGPKD